jgi:hypothetical protein
MSQMYTERTMESRLLAIFDGAPACHPMADWYEDVAQTDCRKIARITGLPLELVAATMAVLSPGPKYAQNMADTVAMCSWASMGAFGERNNPLPVVTTYGANRDKAAAMLDYYVMTGDVDTDHVSGPKVTAFLRNIMGAWGEVTLDRHAVRPISKSGKDMPTGKAERARMESAYRKAAAKRGLQPAQFQAVVWCAVRGGAR